MGGNGVSDISAGASEGVSGMVNGAGLHRGLLQGQEMKGKADYKVVFRPLI